MACPSLSRIPHSRRHLVLPYFSYSLLDSAWFRLAQEMIVSLQSDRHSFHIGRSLFFPFPFSPFLLPVTFGFQAENFVSPFSMSSYPETGNGEKAEKELDRTQLHTISLAALGMSSRSRSWQRSRPPHLRTGPGFVAHML